MLIESFATRRRPTGIALGCACVLSLTILSAASSQQFEVKATKYMMGTEVEIIAQHPGVEQARKALILAFEEMHRIELALSSQDTHSEISAINRAAGGAPVRVSRQTLLIVQRAVDYAKQFAGQFDLTVGPLSDLWGFNSDRPFVLPPPDSVAARVARVNYREVVVNPRDTTIALKRHGMAIDLGGMAKGYAIDRAAMVLRQQGLRNFLINAGGDIYASGMKANAEKWRVGIKHPRKLDELLAVFELSDYAVATSGDYERFADYQGKRYHHILNARTGYPSDRCQSVTVMAATAEKADAWATYLFILGPEAFAEKYPDAAVDVVFVDAAGKLHYDPARLARYRIEFLP